MIFAGTSFKSTGPTFPVMKISKNSTQLTFPGPTFGLEDSPVKTSRWREWATGQGLKENDLACFMTLLASLEKHAPELYCSKTLQASLVRTEETILPLSFKRWPSSGILSAGVCLTANTSESPNHANESTLLGVIETSTVPEKYFLNPNAARGMLRRANRMKRPLFHHLSKALDLDSLRYHALGNAVTPPVAEWLATRVRIYLAARQSTSV